jgi:hypothetical protein
MFLPRRRCVLWRVCEGGHFLFSLPRPPESHRKRPQACASKNKTGPAVLFFWGCARVPSLGGLPGNRALKCRGRIDEAVRSLGAGGFLWQQRVSGWVIIPLFAGNCSQLAVAVLLLGFFFF